MDNTGALSASGSSLASQILSTQHEVSVLKKENDIEKQEGEAKLKLLESASQTTGPQVDPASSVGLNVDVKV